MEWRIKYIEEGKILFIKTKGEMRRSSNYSMLKEIAVEIVKYNCRSCLVDHRDITKALNTVDIYYQAKNLKELNVPQNIRIAVMHPH
jgi:hypothetical protein